MEMDLSEFRTNLHSGYDNLIEKMKKSARGSTRAEKHQIICENLNDLVMYIVDNWNYVGALPKDEIADVLNIIKLAKSENNAYVETFVKMDRYQYIDEFYKNSR